MSDQNIFANFSVIVKIVKILQVVFLLEFCESNFQKKTQKARKSREMSKYNKLILQFDEIFSISILECQQPFKVTSIDECNVYAKIKVGQLL